MEKRLKVETSESYGAARHAPRILESSNPVSGSLPRRTLGSITAPAFHPPLPRGEREGLSNPATFSNDQPKYLIDRQNFSIGLRRPRQRNRVRLVWVGMTWGCSKRATSVTLSNK